MQTTRDGRRFGRPSVNHISLRRAISGVAILTVGTLVALTTGVGTAFAAPGESAHSSGTYLSGGLLAGTLSNAIVLGGETAANTTGSGATQTNRNALNLALLNTLSVTSKGGLVQVPLDIANVGALSQFATADSAGNSTGATGLVASDGTIGVGSVPANQVPGALHVNLGNAVSKLGLPAATTNQIAGLDLALGATSSRAALAPPAATVRTYEIADAHLTFTSPALGSLVSRLNTQVTTLGTAVGGIKAGVQADLLNLVTANVSTPDLTGAVSGLLTGTIGNPTTDGVTIDLATGNVDVNLAHFITLNDPTVDRQLLTPAVIANINLAISSLVNGLVTSVGTALQTALNAVTIKVNAVGLITVNTTVGRLLNGTADGTDVQIAGIPLSLGAVLAALATTVSPLGGVVTNLTTNVANPVLGLVTPAVTAVLAPVVSLETNVQTSVGGVDSVTALRVGILPVILATDGQLDIATSTVGPNVSIPVPTITNLNPNHGPETGGTPVTITGTGLNTATGITIGGVTVPPDTQSATSLTFTTPAHAAGPVNVVVVAPQGNSAPQTYTYDAVASTATGLTPNTGPDSGGTSVTITGSGFIGATGVTFDGTPGTAFTIVDPTHITVTSPAHPAGSAPVVVLDPVANSAPLPFLYTAVAATLSGITPTVGPETGGQKVTLTGTGFNDATGVTFGGVAGTAFTVLSDTSATIITPAHIPATVPVVVVDPAGNSGPKNYQFVSSPSVATSIAPNSGPETGGTPVTITGSGFTGATSVTFDGVPATNFTVVNDTTITANSPAHVAGPVDVVVHDPAGNSAPLTFTYTGVGAVITSLTPDSGPVSGSTSVVIKGTGFLGATGVTFDGLPGTSFTVVNSTTITVVSPPHPLAEAVDVVVHDPTLDSPPQTFTYFDVPSDVTGITPTSGPDVGGTLVTITGSGLLGSTGATFGGIAGTGYAVVDDSTATVTTPPHVAATVPVVVQDPQGDGTGKTFRFINEPSNAISLTPPTGTVAGGTLVTITGTGFTGATGVKFDGTAGTDFTEVSDTTITVRTPAHAVGPVSAVVQDPGGNSGPLGYTYVEVGSVATSIAPATGPDTGGTPVVITGSGFLGATSVTFDGVPGTAFTVVNDTTIDVTTPANAAGPSNVVVVDPVANSAPLVFTFTPGTTITGVAPAIGPEAGGTSVVISGTCFLGATAVRFGTVTVTTFTVNAGGTTITVDSPPGSGIVDVTVIGAPACGTATDPGAFTYVAAASVAVTITPARGTEKGGTHVTITGSGFTGATGVTFDGKAGTHFTVVDDTTITVTTPAHDPGAVSVIVVDPATAVATPLAFTYFAVSNGSPSDPGSGSGLAFTGVDPSMTLLLVLLLLVAGGAMVTVRVRRSRS